MGRKRRSSGGSVRGIPFNKLWEWKTANLAPFLLGAFYILFPWFNTGVLDATTAIFGIVFLTIAIMRSKAANQVLSGMAVGLIGVAYLFAVAGVVAEDVLWVITILLAALFFIMEMGFIKVGPSTQRSDAFQIVPLTILGFALLVSFAGYGTLYIIDFNNTFEMLNYACIMIFCFVYALQLGGWNVTGQSRSTNTLIVALAVGAVATAVMGVYQGTLFQWT